MSQTSLPAPTETAGANATAPPGGRNWVDQTLDTVLSLALLGELIVLFANVLTRSLFRFSILWSQEIAVLALTVLAFVGGALAYRRRQHMAVQAVLDRLPANWHPALAALSNWVVCGVSVVLVAIQIPIVISRVHEQTPVLGVSEAWFALPFTIGLILLALFALERLWQLPRRAVLGTGALTLVLAAVLVAVRMSTGPWEGAAPLWLGALLFVFLLCIGLPIGFVLPTVSLLYLYGSGAALPQAIPINMQGGMNSFVLLAIPFFILAGYIMTEGGLSRPLAEFVRTFVGHLRGGLLQVMVISMYIFSGISGSKVADVAAVGSTMNDMLRKNGYDAGESTAVLASAAIMGETVPPSIAMLVLGSITTLSMGALFMAGILPAAVMALCLMLLVYVRARMMGMQPGEKTPWRERGKAVLRAIPALLVPVILVGGILTGIATPTEVSSFAVVYALALSVLVYRGINLHGFWRLLSETATMAGMILFIVSAGGAFSWSLTIASLPDRIAELLTALGGSTWLFLLATIVILIIMGALLEGLPALLVFGPLLLPVAEQFGINPLQYGIVLIFAMGLGSFAPPIGVGLYVACSVGGASMERTSRHMLPYLVVLILGLVLVAFIPWFSLVLPGLMHGGG